MRRFQELIAGVGGWRSLGVVVAISAATSWAIVRLLEWASEAVIGLPAASPSNPFSDAARRVYESLSTPNVSIHDVIVGRLTPAGQGHYMPPAPWSQLASLQDWTSVIVVFGAIFLGAALVIGLRRPRRWRQGAVALLGLSGAGFLALALAVNSLTGAWDEVFIFASQAVNLAGGHLPGVSVTGPVGVAESSADAAATHVAGALMALAPALAPTTALVVGYLLATVAVLGAVIYLAWRWFHGHVLVLTASCVFLVMLFPENMAALASGVPLMLATAGLVLLGLGLARVLTGGSPWVLVPVGLVSGWIRWEYALLAVLGLVIALLKAWRHSGLRAAWRPAGWALVSLAGAVVIVGGVRKIAFDSWVPSGVRVKVAGIDGAYLHGGLSYLDALRGLTSWDVLLALLIVGLAVIPSVRRFGLAVAIVILPAITAVAAGGDWFPSAWARYLVPSIAAAAFLVVLALASPDEVNRGSSPAAQTGRHRTRLLLPTLVVLAVLGGSTPVAIQVLANLEQPAANRQGEGRTACLARAGELLRLALPPGVGIATAEVNTLAFYAKQPLTDLSGLVDPRVAIAPRAPLAPGDVMHRRANRDIIPSDRPGAIYLFEGISCGNPGLSPSELGKLWNLLVNRQITRFRAGAPQALLASYQPMTLEGPSDSVSVLVRRDLLPTMDKDHDFSYSKVAT